MPSPRRQFLLGAGMLALSRALPSLGAAGALKPGLRLILLGTKGGPRVAATGRRNPATLIVADGVPCLVDCGYGTTLQLLAAGVPLETLRYIFITHHHSDHNLDYGPLFYNSWATGKPMRIDAYGPPGLKRMTRAFLDYQRFDIDARVRDEGRPPPAEFIGAHEFSGSGPVMSTAALRVSALRVRHPSITQAYAFRFDSTGRSIVISGDTAYAPELATFARGADILVHEVMYRPATDALIARLPNARRLRAHLDESHAQPEDVGRIAAAAGVKTVVLTHFVPGDDASISDQQWTAGVHAHFRGDVIVGRDLMEI
jgi:ribonuclease BN (tRNA processing enzyme)